MVPAAAVLRLASAAVPKALIFDSRTRIVEGALEPIEGLPIDSQVLANDNGSHSARSCSTRAKLAQVERYVSSSESLGTLPEHATRRLLSVLRAWTGDREGIAHPP